MDKCVIDAMKLQQRAIAQKLKYWSGGKNYVAGSVATIGAGCVTLLRSELYSAREHLCKHYVA